MEPFPSILKAKANIDRVAQQHEQLCAYQARLEALSNVARRASAMLPEDGRHCDRCVIADSTPDYDYPGCRLWIHCDPLVLSVVAWEDSDYGQTLELALMIEQPDGYKIIGEPTRVNIESSYLATVEMIISTMLLWL